jgi:hypothetical protein
MTGNALAVYECNDAGTLRHLDIDRQMERPECMEKLWWECAQWQTTIW